MQQQILLSYGGTVTSPGLPPSSYAGLTFWYDGDNSAHFIGTTSTSGVPGNLVNFQRFDSVSAINRVLTCAITDPLTRCVPVSSTNAGFNTSVASGGNFWVKPGGGLSPSVAVLFSNLFTASNAIMIFAIRIDSAPAAAVNPYDNPLIMGDASIYMGLHVYASGGNAVFLGLNYDGNYDQVTVTGPAIGSWVVVTMRHTGGQLRIRLNGGAWTSVASGNTANTAQPMTMFFYALNSLDASIAQFCTYNANRADSEVLEVERYFGSRIGIVI